MQQTFRQVLNRNHLNRLLPKRSAVTPPVMSATITAYLPVLLSREVNLRRYPEWLYQLLHKAFISPQATDDEDRRQELILNSLLLWCIVLCLSLCATAVLNLYIRAFGYGEAAAIILGALSLWFCALLIISRRGYYWMASYSFIISLLIFSTYPLIVWGLIMPQGILTYGLVIAICGVLLNSRAAFRVTIVMVATLLVIRVLTGSGLLHPNTAWIHSAAGYDDVLIYGVTFVVLDVIIWLSNRETERALVSLRQSQTELRRQRNQLKVALHKRTRQLERAQIETMRELNRFAEFGRVSSTLLHELANPLTSMSLQLDLLEKQQQDALVLEVRDSLRAMEDYVMHARRHLRHKSEFQAFDAAQAIRQTMQFLEPKARSYKIHLTLDLEPDIQLHGDSVRFEQIIANLVANALDATLDMPEAHHEGVMLSSYRDNNQVVITVKDHGVGIKPRDLKNIFKAFYTTKKTTRGTGLGLTITKQAVEEDFKGTISATSNPKRGTTFTVRLPLS